MIDLVAAKGLPKADGVSLAVEVSTLNNFFQPSSAAEALKQARMKKSIICFGRCELDEGVLRELASSGGAVAFPLSTLLSESGFRRAIALSRMRLLLASCRKSGCGFFACSLASSANETRTAREIAAFMAVLGMHDVEIANANDIASRLVGQ